MRKILTMAVGVLLWSASPSFATWSVMALDRRTGEAVIASATCVAGKHLEPLNGLMGIQAIVVPGQAIAAAQAEVDTTRKTQMLVYEGLRTRVAPEEIIKQLRADPSFELRQIAILDMQGRHVAHSGARNQPASLHAQGVVHGESILYSVQGNLLASDQVVRAAADALVATRGSLTDRVMAAMEAADAAGGDRRCSCSTAPRTVMACSSRTSSVAYLLRIDRNDKPGDSHSDGRYSLYLSVTDADTTEAEDANPVKTLRMRYDAWKRRGPTR